jgi:anti-sigma regulatory factor (Ser/Thr protein kinase)
VTRQDLRELTVPAALADVDRVRSFLQDYIAGLARDRGIPFNPVTKKNPDLLIKLRRGDPGGLGIYFFRTLMDGLSYRRAGGQNILTVRKAI